MCNNFRIYYQSFPLDQRQKTFALVNLAVVEEAPALVDGIPEVSTFEEYEDGFELGVEHC